MKHRHTYARWMGILALAATLSWGCEDKEEIELIDPPEVVITQLIVFDAVALGEQNTKSVVVSNTGDNELVIWSASFTESGDDTLREITVGERFPTGETTVAPGDTLIFDVSWTPQNTIQDQGMIELVMNDRVGTHRVRLETPKIGPRINSPSRLNFRRVSPGSAERLTTFITNEGQAPLQIKDIILNPESNRDFVISYPTSGAEDDPTRDASRPPGSIEPGELVDVRVTFAPEGTQPSRVDMVIFSNDPEQAQYTVDISGNADTACVQLGGAAVEDDPDTEATHTLAFGQTQLDRATARTVQVRNCSRSEDLTLEAIRLVDPGTGAAFALLPEQLPQGLDAGPVTIRALESETFVVTLTPAEVLTYSGRIEIDTNDAAQPTLRVDLSGVGSSNLCPKAVALATVEGSSGRPSAQLSTLPLKTLRLDGSNSSDPDGVVTRYQWSVVQRPAGSMAVPQNAGGMETPFFLDIAGEYVLELSVTDDGGLASCEPARVLVQATPDEDIHVQLVWDTPADADQGDSAGTDIDLHYLHPLGSWNTEPFDIFWRNPTADWGVPGDAGDDPSLDIDDTDGQGPENINHDEPESGRAYGIGVHYYRDNGFGPSYATLRIYIEGLVQYEARAKFLEREDVFWDVGAVVWPSRQIIIKDRLSSGFPR